MTSLLQRFASDESAATAVEYGIMIMMIGLAVSAGAGTLFATLEALFTDNNSSLVKALTGAE
ncbi:MAG TPA: Flp family type IVb pilin [Rhizobiaceae bacterium]|nr:Flp family type IVb pilin [Rhizobiaceae bacterium]